jgi:Holliday junction DNA helicase RuvA
MISRIEGTLLSLDEGHAMLACGALAYEVLVPGADQQRLATMIGQAVSFHTLHYLESQNNGASFVPRLIGFSSPGDREFFELFTTVKGIGNRKALRALQLPFATVAAAIADRDVDLLKSLPEIGKRSAESIVVELHGKVDRFAEVKPGAASDATGRIGAADNGDARSLMIRDTVGMLVQLGEQKAIARQLVDRALAVDPSIQSPDALLSAAYRLKELR